MNQMNLMHSDYGINHYKQHVSSVVISSELLFRSSPTMGRTIQGTKPPVAVQPGGGGGPHTATPGQVQES